MKQESPRYWYPLSYAEAEADIALAEAEILLGDAQFLGPIAVSSVLREPRHTAHLSARLLPLARAASADALLEEVGALDLSAERFMVHVRHLHTAKSAEYRSLASQLGSVIGGSADLTDPETLFWALETADGWWFGQVEASASQPWRRFAPHEHTFSSALPPRLASACVSMACPEGGAFLDPCCGCGTLVLQAAGIGLTAVGADLSMRMVWLTRKNLRQMNLRALVCRADARSIAGAFDGVATNLPYGKYLARPPGLYEDIARNLAAQVRRAVLVCAEDCTSLWQQAGFRVPRVARLSAQALVRYIHVCTSALAGSNAG
jgi:tRNA G10  N-methylase Trm11